MIWLIQSWHVLLPKPWAAIGLAIIAVLCGAWVGSERERRDKPAGRVCNSTEHRSAQ
jgi:hypothetical protein